MRRRLGSLHCEERACHERECAKQNGAVRMLTRECAPSEPHHHCTPQAAMLGGLSELLRPSGRAVRVASQVAGDAGEGGTYSAGALNIHRPGFFYPHHFDAINANAWLALRKWFCAEPPSLDKNYVPEGVSQYSVRRHPFTTAAIFTLQAPDRMLNPYDLRVYRARWQALVHNCSITSTTAYGLGQRLDRATFPSVSHADLRGDEGDLYVFNSEHVHTTPPIRGKASRGVLSSIVGLSADAGDAEVWG